MDGLPSFVPAEIIKEYEGFIIDINGEKVLVTETSTCHNGGELNYCT